ncbi:MAG TPA: septum formation initiator family protein [Limnochordia bacterium]
MAGAVYVAGAYAAGCWRLWQLRREIASAERRVTAMVERNAQLRAVLARMDTDAYIEQVAREKLGLVEPGERPYVIAAPRDPTSPFYVERRPGEPTGLTGGEGW